MGSGRATAAEGALAIGAVAALLSGAVVGLALSVVAEGQQIQQIAQHRAGAAYDVARESVISGKIVQYSSASTTSPLGARISLQTGSGTIEAHAGNAKLIEASNISLQAGDTVSITGETVTFGNASVFVARIILKGSQSVTVRSKNGVPLLPTAVAANGKIVSPAGPR
jgi:DNA/RNA endonuclease YhcR with UshA esterase domain